MKGGFLSKLTNLDYINHMCFTMRPLNLSLEVLRAAQLVTVDIYCFQLEKEMNAALVPF